MKKFIKPLVAVSALTLSSTVLAFFGGPVASLPSTGGTAVVTGYTKNLYIGTKDCGIKGGESLHYNIKLSRTSDDAPLKALSSVMAGYANTPSTEPRSGVKVNGFDALHNVTMSQQFRVDRSNGLKLDITTPEGDVGNHCYTFVLEFSNVVNEDKTRHGGPIKAEVRRLAS